MDDEELGHGDIESGDAATGGAEERKEERRKRRMGEGGEPLEGGALGTNMPTGKDLGKMRQIIVAMAKLNMIHSQQIRLLRSVVLQVVMMTETMFIPVAMKEGTKRFKELAEKMKGQTVLREQRLRAPYLHAWNKILKHAADHLQGQAAQDLEKYVKDAKSGGKGLAGYEAGLRTFHLEKAYEKGKVKVVVSCTEGSAEERIWGHLKEYACSKGARAMPGKAPPGHLDRVIQDWIKNNTEEKTAASSSIMVD